MSLLYLILQGLFILLLCILVIVGIVALVALARFIWITVKFTRIFKLQKYDEAKLKSEREYNVITAESQQLAIANDNIRNDYATTALELKDMNATKKTLNQEIQKQRDLLKELEDKTSSKSKK